MCSCGAVTLEQGYIYQCVVFRQQYNFCNLLHTLIAFCTSMFRRHGCEEDLRVLDVQHRFVWEVNVEGHSGGCSDDISSVLLF